MGDGAAAAVFGSCNIVCRPDSVRPHEDVKRDNDPERGLRRPHHSRCRAPRAHGAHGRRAPTRGAGQATGALPNPLLARPNAASQPKREKMPPTRNLLACGAHHAGTARARCARLQSLD
jgi:hypothetical protein